MKNKPLELKVTNRDLVITPNADQANLSNQLKTESITPGKKNFSKSDYIAFIEGMIKTISQSKDPQTLELIPVLEFAKSEIGKCVVCVGVGGVVTASKPDQHYKAMKGLKGNIYYLVSCKSCHGTGKQLSIQCASCGENAKIMPEQRHFSHCQECETKLIKSGVLL